MTEHNGSDKQIAAAFSLGFICYLLPRLFQGTPWLLFVCLLLRLPSFLWAVFSLKKRKGILLGFPVFFVAQLLQYADVLGKSTEALLFAAAGTLLFSLLRYASFVLNRIMVRKTGSLFAVFIFPVFATLVEFLINKSGIGNFLNPVTAVYDIPVLLQGVHVIGEAGMTFLLFMFYAFLFAAVALPGKKRIVSLCIAVLTAAAPIAYGVNRLTAETETLGTIKAAMAYTYKIDFFGGDDGSLRSAETQMTALKDEMRQAVIDGADIFLCHEEYLCVSEEDWDVCKQQAAAICRELSLPLMLTADIKIKDSKGQNRAAIIDGNGDLLLDVEKTSLVPLIESTNYIEGTGRLITIPLRIGDRVYQTSVAICFDANDYFLCKSLAQDTELLFVPAWEWDNVNLVQVRNICARAVEAGLTMVKPTYDGFSTVIDPLGRIISQTDTRGLYESVTYAEFPVSICR